MVQEQSQDRAQAVSACKHLLRHLWDAKALHGNALAEAFLLDSRRSLSDLRATVMTICEELTKANSGAADDDRLTRRRQIVIRCDLGRQPHAHVARDLGLSMRQFYRERSEICEQVAVALLQTIRSNARPPAIAFEVGKHEFSRAKALRRAGNFDGAKRLMESMASDETEPALRIESSCELASLLLFAGDPVLAQRTLDSAENTVPANKLGKRTTLCTARIAAERSSIAWFSGNGERSKAIDCGELSARALAEPAGCDGVEFAGAFAIQQANRAMLMGDFQRSLQLLARAQALIAMLPTVPPALAVDLLVNTGAANSITRGPREATRRAFSRALAITTQSGMTEQGAFIVAASTSDAQVHGEFAPAGTELRELLRGPKTYMSPLNYGLICLRAAELFAEAREPAEALRYLSESRTFVRSSGLATMIADLLAAKIYVAARQYDSAISAAMAAQKAARAAPNGRAAGASLHTLAKAQWAVGKARDAVESIDHALEYLQRCGHPLALQRAYADSATITGNRAHGRAARELRATTF